MALVAVEALDLALRASAILAFALVWLLGDSSADPPWLRTAFYAVTGLGVVSVVYSLLQRKIAPTAHLAQILNLSHALMFVYLAELAFDA